MTTEALVRTLWPFALCVLACATKAYVGEVPKGWSCPSGKFTDVGKTNKITIGLTCRNCPVGKYQVHASPLPCKYCPQGRFSARGSKDCYRKRHFKFKMPRLPCPAGRFRPKELGPGNTLHGGCTACPAGRFGARKGLTDAFCTGTCRAGRYGSGGSTSSVCTGGVEEVPIGHMEPLVPEPRPAPTPVPTPQTPKPTPAPVAAPTPVPTPRVTSAPTPRVTIAPREDASNLIIPKGTTCQGDKCECRPNAGCNTCWECCNEDIAKNAAVSSGTVVTKSPSGHQMMIYSCIQCVAFACNQFLQSPTPAPTPDYTIIPGHN